MMSNHNKLLFVRLTRGNQIDSYWQKHKRKVCFLKYATLWWAQSPRALTLLVNRGGILVVEIKSLLQVRDSETMCKWATNQGEEICVAILQTGAVGLMAGVSHFSLDISPGTTTTTSWTSHKHHG